MKKKKNKNLRMISSFYDLRNAFAAFHSLSKLAFITIDKLPSRGRISAVERYPTSTEVVLATEKMNRASASST